MASYEFADALTDLKKKKRRLLKISVRTFVCETHRFDFHGSVEITIALTRSVHMKAQI